MVTVIDANVMVKLLVDEPLSELARFVMANHSPFHAPDLIRIEVSSAITRKVRNRQLPVEMAQEKLHEWKKFLADENLTLIPSEELLEEAEKLSITLRHSLKDCLYLAAANRHDASLITADQPFIDAIGKKFSNIRHLSAFAG